MKLDLGAGEVSPEGYTPMGNAHGTAVYPLPYPDASVDVVRASHILEHVPFDQVDETVREWVRVLKPGGILRIAVPDFLKIASAYVDGAKIDTIHYVMGGQMTPDDFHRSLFDEALLRRTLAGAGLVLIKRWESEIGDCASLDVSLNLQGTKPFMSEISVTAVMSSPRLGFMDNFCSVQEGLMAIGGRVRVVRGAYWAQCLERGIEDALREENPDYILTLDYDTVIGRSDLAMLMQLAMAHRGVDAIAAVQAGRGSKNALFTVHGEAMEGRVHVPREAFAADIMPVATAHFGMTLIRSDALRKLRKPWFLDVPDADGGWGPKRQDADVAFWRKWEAHGLSVWVANRVVVGHLELGVLWPGESLESIFQPIDQWQKSGKPQGVWK